MEIIKHVNFVTGTKCYVEGCQHLAEFEVYLYDYYEHMRSEFFEQDYTCPFLCKEHMEGNESESHGEKRPRGMVHYPYTNQNNAQGYTRYEPISEVYPILYLPNQGLILPETQILISDVNDELLRFLAHNPEYLRIIEPRRFEEVVAEIFRTKGYDVRLTQRTRDGGFDIYAIKHEIVGTMHFVIECKRYAENYKVGVELVRALNGVVDPNVAHRGVFVTTSSFTSSAIKFASPLEHRLSLKDYNDLTTWLAEYRT